MTVAQEMLALAERLDMNSPEEQRVRLSPREREIAIEALRDQALLLNGESGERYI